MLGWQEILLILILALVLFGAKKLPEIGSSLGKAMKEFKKGLSGIEKEDNEILKSENKNGDIK